MPLIVSPTGDQIDQAVRRLRAGGVVAFPTETVYGIGADTFNPAAIELIYQLKGRPFSNPLIAHVLDWKQAKRLFDVKSQVLRTGEQMSLASSLASRFWPGPLTLVLPKAGWVPSRATAGLPTIAVRSPAHPVARQLLESFGSPISAPSANRSGHVSPTTAAHVMDDFADSPNAENLLILDGGACEVGIESTVLDLSVTGERPRVLRPGAVTVEQLRVVIGEVDAPTITHQSTSPGTSEQHYAPHTLTELVQSSEMSDRLRRFGAGEAAVVLTFHPERVAPPHRAMAMPTNPAEYARAMYRTLREADAMGSSRILIESPPREGDLWQAIHDRLKRATSHRHSQSDKLPKR